MHADEKDLLERIFAAEPGAFEELLARYRALIYSVFVSPGFDFPRDMLDDLFQSFVVALSRKDYHKLRAFEGRNACSLATFLQVVATRFALDERRRLRRQPRARGTADRGDDEPNYEIEDEAAAPPDSASLEKERADAFHNLLFSLDWKRISAVLWVFRDISRERIAEVMSTSRANIDALYKRAKDQMARLYADGAYSRAERRPHADVLTPAVAEALRRLVRTPTPLLLEALLQPGAKRRALLGLVLIDYPQYLCTLGELAKLTKERPANVESECLSVLEGVALTLQETPMQEAGG